MFFARRIFVNILLLAAENLCWPISKEPQGHWFHQGGNNHTNGYDYHDNNDCNGDVIYELPTERIIIKLMIQILTTMMIVMMILIWTVRAHNNQVNNYCDSYDNDVYMKLPGIMRMMLIWTVRAHNNQVNNHCDFYDNDVHMKLR